MTVAIFPLQFCCWENWSFSVVVINELLLEVSSIEDLDLSLIPRLQSGLIPRLQSGLIPRLQSGLIPRL